VRIVRTFKPFPEPIVLPPDTVMRADAAMRGNAEGFVDGTDTVSGIATSSCDGSQYSGPPMPGEAVNTLAPHTEAQPEAILLFWLATLPP
jgi:hypothetical protein